MNAPFGLAEAFSYLSLGNRNPTWGEYEASAPCDQRAILARWQEIIATPCNDFADLIEVAKAMGRRGRAMDKPVTLSADFIQRDYDRTIDSRQNYEHGE